MCISKKKLETLRGWSTISYMYIGGGHNFMSSMSRSSQDTNFCGKNSQKSVQYSQSYDNVCQRALLQSKGFTLLLSGHPQLSGKFSKSQFLAHTKTVFVNRTRWLSLVSRYSHLQQSCVCLSLLLSSTLNVTTTGMKWPTEIFCCEL